LGSWPDPHRGRRRRHLLPVVAVVTVVALAPALLAWHWARAGWRDWHRNYPGTPTGFDQIVNRFGQPCSNAASDIRMSWTAADNDQTYTFRFHRKLGGYPTEMVRDQGGRSTNLDNDVYGHIQNDHLGRYAKSGIWGYVCRYIRGTTTWSTHAWGIAVDISSAYEPMGQCHSTTNENFAHIFRHHGWRWGLDFCDPMHFQYAYGY
jgi:D-alanyl-D-alanine carboxypeptidase